MNSLILALREKLATRQLSSVELTKAFLKKSEGHTAGKGTNSFIALAAEKALAQAAAADKAGYGSTAPALRGIPLALKDNMITAGVATTCASKILEGFVPPYDGDVARRLGGAGAVTLGKLNMDEFAMGGSNEHSAFGAVKNPVDQTRVPGGSSGGSAAAVRAGLAVGTYGSDTGGSIRLPAAYCGVVGLKPTYGLVSRYGLVAFASSLDQIGPLAPTVDDAAILLSAVAGQDGLSDQDSTLRNLPPMDYLAESQKAPGKKLRLGWCPELVPAGGDKYFEAALKFFEARGDEFELVEVSLPHATQAVAVYYVTAVCEASSNLARFDGVRYGPRAQASTLNDMYMKTRALFGAEVKRRLMLGTYALSAGYYDAYYLKAAQVRRLIAGDFAKAFQKCDALISPVSTTPAFKFGERQDPLTMYKNDQFTIPANLAGLPGISVPCGVSAEGLPIGLQIVGPALSEARLLWLARQVEESHCEPTWVREAFRGIL